MAGLVEVFESYEIGILMAQGINVETQAFEALRQVVIEEDVEVYVPKAGDRLQIGKAGFKVLWPEQSLGLAKIWQEKETGQVLGEAVFADDVNESSIVLEIKFFEFDAILTGDIGLDTEQALINQGVLEKVEVVKIAHHGSKYSSGVEFLEAIKPDLAVISVGANNRYGHPTRDTLIRLERVGAQVLRTDFEGDIEIVSNGQDYWVLN